MEHKTIVICDALRTPFGHGTIMEASPPAMLLQTIIEEIVKRSSLDPGQISAVITGCIQQDTRSTNIARIGAMMAGLPETVNAYSIQCNCNSGFMGILSAIGGIYSGTGDLYITTGVESMSRFGYRLERREKQSGNLEEMRDLIRSNGNVFLENFDLVDCTSEGLSDNENNLSMIEIAEIMASCFRISREEQDEYALRCLKKAFEAVESGILSSRIISIGEVTKDTYPLNRKRLLKRPEKFARTNPVFAQDNPFLPASDFYLKHKNFLAHYNIDHITPSVTMYNSCIPGDGAGGCIITTEDKARALNLNPLVKIINWAVVGVNPTIMGIGPLESTYKLFTEPKTGEARGICFNDIDLIEIHEAFASQVLSVFKEGKRKYDYNWENKEVNPYGGSLAYTHPLGATNMRLLTNILTRLEENPTIRYALACGCAGGGQGTSLLLERM